MPYLPAAAVNYNRTAFEFDVKRFGAVGNGATNDAAAIQSAINAAVAVGGGVVFFPTGTYLVSSELSLSASVILQGAGREYTIIKSNSSGSDYIFHKSSASTVSGIEISDITFDANNRTAGSCLRFQYVDRLKIQRCGFKNVPTSGWGVHIGVLTGSDSVIRNTDILIDDCYFDTFVGTLEALLLYNARDVTVRNCTFSNGTSNAIGIALYQLLENVTIENCDFRNVSQTSIYYSISTNNITISGCSFVYSSGSSMSGIRGANESDNGAFGFTHVRHLVIANCYFALANGDPIPLQLGAVRDAKVVNCRLYRCNGLGILLNRGNSPVNAASQEITIMGCDFRENNQQGTVHALHPGIYVTGQSDDLNLSLYGNTFVDDQATATQRFPLVFDGANTWNKIRIFGNRMSAYDGVQSIRLDNSAALGAQTEVFGNTDFSAPNSISSARYRFNEGMSPLGVTSISPGASPYTYTNNDGVPEAIYLRAGTVSDISKNSVTLFTATPATVWLEPGEALTVTYSSVPTMVKDRK